MAAAPVFLPNNFLATESGLIVPPAYASRSSSSNEVDQKLRSYSYFCGEGFSFGQRLPRDPDTLVIQWAPKGSGLDDLLLAAIADGEIANVGIAPVMFDQLTALIKRRQEQINSASVVVTGRETPATRALNALARMNDSPLGVIAGMKRILYQLDVFNRGAPIATIPITHPAEQWEGEGLHLRPILNTKGEVSGKYYLEVDWRGRSPVPYLPSVFDLEPTGNVQWPYWYQVTLDNSKKKSWVLLHQSQIISLLASETNRAGIGTSPAWICLPIMAENTLVIDERYEKLIDKPTEGIMGISGVTQPADAIRAKIDEPNHTWTLLASPNDIKFGGWSFRQADGVDPQKRQQHFEDVLAAAFNEHISAVAIRGGVGFGVQADAAADNVAENGVFALLQAIEISFGALYPHVSIRVTKTNDRARRLGLELLGMFTTAVQKLPEGTFTRDELRALIDRDHFTIPITGADISQSDARPGSGAENDEQPQASAGSRPEDPRSPTRSLAVIAGNLLLDCRSFLLEVISQTPEHQFQLAIRDAHATAATIQPEQWVNQLLDLARRFHQSLYERNF